MEGPTPLVRPIFDWTEVGNQFPQAAPRLDSSFLTQVRLYLCLCFSLTSLVKEAFTPYFFARMFQTYLSLSVLLWNNHVQLILTTNSEHAKVSLHFAATYRQKCGNSSLCLP